MTPTYFLPHLLQAETAAVQAKLRECGLTHLEDVAGKFHPNQTTSGPGGLPGLMVCVQKAPGESGASGPCNYMPDHQEWRDCGQFWIGWQKASPPRPADLQRSADPPGLPVKDSAGHEWRIPVARVDWAAGAGVFTAPRGFRMVGGKPVMDKVPTASQWLLDIGKRWQDVRYGGTAEDVASIGYERKADLFLDCCKLLAFNYCVGPYECSANCFDIVTTFNMWEIMDAVIDLPASVAEAEAKAKNEAAPPLATSNT